MRLVYFFTGFNPGIVNTALFLFTPPPPSDNTSRNRRRAISRMVITQINGLPQGTPSYKSSSVRRFTNFLNTLLWSTQHPGTCIRAMLIVHPLPAIFTALFFYREYNAPRLQRSSPICASTFKTVLP